VAGQLQAQVQMTSAALTERPTSAAAAERRRCAFCSSLTSAAAAANFSTTNNNSQRSQIRDYYAEVDHFVFASKMT